MNYRVIAARELHCCLLLQSRRFAHMPLGLFRSQQNGAVTRMWRSCCVKPLKERGIGAVRCEKEGMLLQPLRWRCVECLIHHKRDVREEQQYIYVARTSNNRVIAARELYCCLLPHCEALRTCRSGFSDRNTMFFPSSVADGIYGAKIVEDYERPAYVG